MPEPRDIFTMRLHDMFGCRITCRGGRLADDGHPVHAEAYADHAARLLDGYVLVKAETLAAPVARFVRRVGGLTVRFENGKEYVRVPSEWIDDLTAYLAALRGDTDA